MTRKRHTEEQLIAVLKDATRSGNMESAAKRPKDKPRERWTVRHSL